MPPVLGPSISPELQLAGGIVLMGEISSHPSVPVEISSLATGIFKTIAFTDFCRSDPIAGLSDGHQA